MPSTLRELADRCHFTLGAATLSERNFLANPAYQQLHTQHFNLLVPANAMK
ncbi:MAG: endo-1,4-beta-xylanase [Leptolyngbya sp. SIOISBB]|nr:endo-1,4-beta-xylanase [Leptolyngbya sp. SIOISBB]